MISLFTLMWIAFATLSAWVFRHPNRVIALPGYRWTNARIVRVGAAAALVICLLNTLLFIIIQLPSE